MIDSESVKQELLPDNVISLTKVTKRYKVRDKLLKHSYFTALDNVSLSIRKGEIFGLLGSNGAGKTTLIKIMAGLLEADEGEGCVLGHDMYADHKKIRSLVSLVAPTADVGTDNNLTVRQNLEFWAVVYDLEPALRKSRIDEMLELLELKEYENFWPMSISAGTRQRLAIARSLLVKNPVIFLDEPTVKLDAKGAKSVRHFIRKVNEEYGITIILTTHYIHEAEEICGRVAIMDKGKIVSCGLVDELRKALRKYDSAVIACGHVPLELLHKMRKWSRVISCEYNGGKIELTSEHIEDGLREALILLRSNNIEIMSIASNQPTLEEIFVSTLNNGLGENESHLADEPEPFERVDAPLVSVFSKSFAASCLAFAWLDFKALKMYPSNMILTIIQSFVTTGIWFFVSLFLEDYAQQAMGAYGGDFVAFMVIGVILFQNAGNIMVLPFQSLSTAFWDKRLEIYNSSPNGIWSYICGKFIWSFTYNLVIQAAVLLAAVYVAGVNVSRNIPIAPAAAIYLLFILTCFGIGLVGAGNFFMLEVKQGREPVTWLTDVFARIFSGVYYPLAVLPVGIQFVSAFLPHTYAMNAIRLVMLGGNGFEHSLVARGVLVLALFCAVFVAGGVWWLSRAMSIAERGNGIGAIV